MGICALFLAGAPQTNAKEHGHFVTAEMRANALANAEKHEWAGQRQQQAIAAAAPWVDRTDDELWAMVPPQDLPRTVHTNKGVIYERQEPYCPDVSGNWRDASSS